ncbi:diaminopimelate epimerase [Chloroflexota bacterium]
MGETLKFAKLQATGNDFILIDAGDVERDWLELAREMCHRRQGIGADGLLLLLPSDVADFRMRIFNPDGSEAEACGNGLRCLTKYVTESGSAGKAVEELAIETMSGIRKVRPHIVNNRVIRAEVSMGRPHFGAEEIPLSKKIDKTPIIDYPLRIAGRRLPLTFVSMGNPHAVCFPRRPVEEFPLTTVGPEVEYHPLFPQRTNFEVATILDRGQIAVRVWERGVGETPSCGSGACAVAIAAQLHGYVDHTVDIMLPGGKVTVCWDRGGEVLLTGPVKFVFAGEWIREG